MTTLRPRHRNQVLPKLSGFALLRHREKKQQQQIITKLQLCTRRCHCSRCAQCGDVFCSAAALRPREMWFWGLVIYFELGLFYKCSGCAIWLTSQFCGVVNQER